VSALPVISRPVEIVTIGAEQSVARIEIGTEERKALAAALELVDIPALSAEIGLSRDRGGTVHLDGRLSAELVQNCVVSLEPVRQTIEEPIRLSFVESARDARPSAAVDIVPTEDDPPEILDGPILDLGPIVVEQLLLGIDPYPRAPGAAPPDNPAGETGATRDSPFSALAPLIGSRRGDADR
jgi:uncharacterized metal-binding protein YceD (DUF177 family)